MAFSFEKRGAVGTLKCEGGLDADRAQTLSDALMVCIENSDHVVVNCSGVNTIDSQCIQIFCAVNRTAVRSNKKLMLSGIPPDILTLKREEIINLCSSHSSLGCNNSCIWGSQEVFAGG